MSKNALNATSVKVRIDDGIKDSLCGDVGLKRFVPIVLSSIPALLLIMSQWTRALQMQPVWVKINEGKWSEDPLWSDAPRKDGSLTRPLCTDHPPVNYPLPSCHYLLLPAYSPAPCILQNTHFHFLPIFTFTCFNFSPSRQFPLCTEIVCCLIIQCPCQAAGANSGDIQ